MRSRQRVPMVVLHCGEGRGAHSGRIYWRCGSDGGTRGLSDYDLCVAMLWFIEAGGRARCSKILEHMQEEWGGVIGDEWRIRYAENEAYMIDVFRAACEDHPMLARRFGAIEARRLQKEAERLQIAREARAKALVGKIVEHQTHGTGLVCRTSFGSMVEVDFFCRGKKIVPSFDLAATSPDDFNYPGDISGWRVFHDTLGFGYVVLQEGQTIHIDFERTGYRPVQRSFVRLISGPEAEPQKARKTKRSKFETDGPDNAA